jgi:hypothetical protein
MGQQMAALRAILEAGKVNIQAGNFRDVREFFEERDAEESGPGTSTGEN